MYFLVLINKTNLTDKSFAKMRILLIVVLKKAS